MLSEPQRILMSKATLERLKRYDELSTRGLFNKKAARSIRDRRRMNKLNRRKGRKQWQK